MTELQNLKLKYNGNRVVDGGRVLASYIIDDNTAAGFNDLTIASKPRQEVDGSWTILLPIQDLNLVIGQEISATAEVTPAFNADGTPVIGKNPESPNYGKEIMNFRFTGVATSQVVIDNTAKAEISAPAIFHLMNKFGCSFEQAAALYNSQESAFNKRVADARKDRAPRRRVVVDRSKTSVLDFLNLPKAQTKTADKVKAVAE